MTGFMAAVRGVLRHPTVRLLLGTAALTTGVGLLQALATDVATDLSEANTELKHKTAERTALMTEIRALKAEVRERMILRDRLAEKTSAEYSAASMYGAAPAYPSREDVDPLGHAQAVDGDDWHPAPAGAESSDAG